MYVCRKKGTREGKEEAEVASSSYNKATRLGAAGLQLTNASNIHWGAKNQL